MKFCDLFLCMLRKISIFAAMDNLRINYKSDFDFPLIVFDNKNSIVSLAKYDWTLTLSTYNSKKAFVASHRGREYVNAAPRSGGAAATIICDNHGLDCGQIIMEFCIEIPDAKFPDKFRRIVSRITTAIVLTQSITNVSSLGLNDAIKFHIPDIKGDAQELPEEPEKPGVVAPRRRNCVGADGRCLVHKGIMPLWADSYTAYRNLRYLKFSRNVVVSIKSGKSAHVAIPSWIVIENLGDLQPLDAHGAYMHQRPADIDVEKRIIHIQTDWPELNGVENLLIQYETSGAYIYHDDEIMLGMDSDAVIADQPFVPEPTLNDVMSLASGTQSPPGYLRWRIRRRGNRLESNHDINGRWGHVPRDKKYWCNRIFHKRSFNNGRVHQCIVQVWRETRGGFQSAKSVWSICKGAARRIE